MDASRQAEILDALNSILESPRFRSSENLQKFLRYVVHEELDGRGGSIKAYTIAIDALGRPASFDPQSDPSIRVEAGRLRNMLAAYYATDGINDKIRIELPKGGYRPQFRLEEQTGAQGPHHAWLPGILAKTLNVPLWAAGSAALALVLLLAYVLSQPPASTSPADDEAELPIVAVAPFNDGPGSPSGIAAEGIRGQLITDLSQFRQIRVRAITGDGETARKLLSSADYRIEGVMTVQEQGSEGLNLTLTDARDSEVLWAGRLDFPSNDAEFHQTVFDGVRAIVVELAARSGIIYKDELTRIRERHAALKNADTSAYECVILFHAYDVAKAPEDEVAAHDCLKGQIESGSRNSMVWAAWSFMLFLEWTRQEDAASELMTQAVATARKAIQLDPFNALAHEFLGSILLARGNRNEALEAYLEAQRLNPSKPDLHVLLGWHELLEGDWKEGIAGINMGIEMSPAPPGWMWIPLSIDAFMEGQYGKALEVAELVVQLGDNRGVVLALAAAAEEGNEDKEAEYRERLNNLPTYNAPDPMREIRRILNIPEIIGAYEKALLKSGV